MVTLDQIRSLEAKVQRAVAYIADLKEENALLQKNLEKYRMRIDELEVLINRYKDDQNEIEQGVLNALSHLDRLEDDISRTPAPPAASGSGIPEVEDIEARPVRPLEEPASDGKGGIENELDIF